MKLNRPSKIIRTDKWTLNPNDEQRVFFTATVEAYRKLCRFLVTVVNTHWVELGPLSNNDVIPALERLMHPTAKNPVVKYTVFSRVFYKFPSYYRRAAICVCGGPSIEFSRSISGLGKRQFSHPKEIPNLPHSNCFDAGCYPTLYKGQCYKLHGFDSRLRSKCSRAPIGYGSRLGISGLGHRHQVVSNRMASPSLILSSRSCHLSVPFDL